MDDTVSLCKNRTIFNTQLCEAQNLQTILLPDHDAEDPEAASFEDGFADWTYIRTVPPR